MNERLRLVRPAWLPVAIVVLAASVVWLGRPLPPTLSGLRTVAPYTTLIAALVLAWWFNRGRSFVIAASILAGFAAWQIFPTKAVYTALVVIVPLNCLAAMLVPDRGARHGPAYRWLLVLVLEAIVVAWIASAGKSPVSGTAWLSLLDQWWLRSPPTPFVGRLAFGAAFAGAVYVAWPDFKPTPVGNAGAIAAFFIAAEWAGSPSGYAIFMTACGLILLGAVLQESHQLAFRDTLTGLPGRRALDERLRSLGEHYVVAMVDVDHFKKFNDTHGHDVGDQVLRLVGGRLAQVGGGGIAYRYGGEEFSVIFPNVGVAEAEGAMESIRDSIEHYKMAVRSSDRPKQADEGAKRRGEGHAEQMLSVTVSIGLASPSEKHLTPQRVIMAADEALYRAKKAGRNRVSR